MWVLLESFSALQRSNLSLHAFQDAWESAGCNNGCVCGFQNDSVVAGGGAIEMELSKYLRDYSRTIPGKQQLLIGAYAKALEIIPRQLCDNAGFDATNILNKLRAKHAQVASRILKH